MFDSNDYLAPKQMKSFLSCLAKKRRKVGVDDDAQDEMYKDEGQGSISKSLDSLQATSLRTLVSCILYCLSLIISAK